MTNQSPPPPPAADEDKIVNFHVTSNFGYRTQKPFVSITVQSKEFHVQMSPAAARALAMNLLQAAEAAETDAFLVGFFKSRIDMNERNIATILLDFRDWRDAARADD